MSAWFPCRSSRSSDCCMKIKFIKTDYVVVIALVFKNQKLCNWFKFKPYLNHTSSP